MTIDSSLAPGVVALLQASESKLVSEMFLSEYSSTGALILPPPKPDQSRFAVRAPSKVSMHLNIVCFANPNLQPEVPQNQANKRALTVGAQFKNSLVELMDRMTACNPHFVRCIKPNTNKAPQDFNDGFVLAQLRYTGEIHRSQIKVHMRIIEFQVCWKPPAFDARDTLFALDLRSLSSDSVSWLLDRQPKSSRVP